jgi:hypothetical protein
MTQLARSPMSWLVNKLSDIVGRCDILEGRVVLSDGTGGGREAHLQSIRKTVKLMAEELYQHRCHLVSSGLDGHRSEGDDRRVILEANRLRDEHTSSLCLHSYRSLPDRSGVVRGGDHDSATSHSDEARIGYCDQCQGKDGSLRIRGLRHQVLRPE